MTFPKQKDRPVTVPDGFGILCAVSAILTRDAPLEKLFDELVAVIPKGWPEDAGVGVRIILGKREYRTPGPEMPAGVLRSPLRLHGTVRGTVELFFPRQAPPFLPEEKQLLDTVAVLLVQTLEQREQQGSLRHSEQLFREFVEGSGDLVARVDGRGNVLYTNRQAAAAFGLSSPECLGRHVFELLPSNEREKAQNAFREWFEEKREQATIENRQPHADGSIRCILWDIRIHYNSQGDVDHINGIGRDITFQKVAETKLRTLFDHARFGILAADVTTKRFVFANRRICRMLGYDEAELLELGFADVHPPSVKSMVARTFEAAARNRRNMVLDLPMRRKDGTVFYAEGSASLVDSAENPYLIGIFQDITQTKQLLDELMETRNALAKAQEVARMGAFDHDIATNIQSHSRILLTLLGLPPSKESMPIREFISMLNPGDREKLIQTQREIFQSRSESGSLEVRFIRPDGKAIDLFITASIKYARNGTPVIVRGLMQDITERRTMERELRESEELFRTLSENILTGIILYNKEKIIHVNPAAREILGYQPATLKKQFREKRLTPNLQSLLDEEQPLMEDDGDLTLFYKAVEVTAKNSHIRWLQIETNAIIYRGAAARIAVFTDITQEKVAQERLETTTLQLRDLNRDLEERIKRAVEENRQQEQLLLQQSRFAQMGEMLSMIAHQWRQPLNAISATAINLRLDSRMDALKSTTVEEQARFIENQTGRMSETINDFMELFRPAKTKTAVSLIGAVTTVEKIIGAQMQSRDITISADIPDGLSVMGSKNELEHLFLNLIGNARDAYENRTLSNKEIRIDAHRQNGDVILTVSDNAGGIPEDIQERIFDPYFTTKSDGKGTGIGLYMTKMIVERNFGGTIAAANRAGGAVFTITFRSEP